MSSRHDRVSFWRDIKFSWKDSNCNSSAAMADLSDAMSASVIESGVFRAVALLLTGLWHALF